MREAERAAEQAAKRATEEEGKGNANALSKKIDPIPEFDGIWPLHLLDVMDEALGFIHDAFDDADDAVQAGAEVLAYSASAKKMRAATVTAVNGDGTYAVQFKASGEKNERLEGKYLKQVGPEVLEQGIVDEEKLAAVIDQLSVWRNQINQQNSYAALAELLKCVEGGPIDIKNDLPQRCKVHPVSHPNGGIIWLSTEGIAAQEKDDEARGAEAAASEA